jgi:hypothetical protein
MIKLTTPLEDPASHAPAASEPPPAPVPMSQPSGGSTAHQSAVRTAELTRQNAVAAAGNSQSSVKAADIAFHRAVVASAIANNNYSGIEPSMSALKSLGVSGL